MATALPQADESSSNFWKYATGEAMVLGTRLQSAPGESSHASLCGQNLPLKLLGLVIVRQRSFDEGGLVGLYGRRVGDGGFEVGVPANTCVNKGAPHTCVDKGGGGVNKRASEGKSGERGVSGSGLTGGNKARVSQ